jgi:A/G-specific adenine glycosylase
LQETCVALREGRVSELPVKQKTLKVKERRLTYVYVRYHGQTALRRRPAGDIWQGLYEPLTFDNTEMTIDQWAALNGYQLSIANCQPIAKHVRHMLTHRIILADFWLWQPDERPTLPDGYFWADEADIDQYGISRLVEIMLESLP